ncbi:hypothetical protein Dimus_020739, partial [Dionaea muscipula]
MVVVFGSGLWGLDSSLKQARGKAKPTLWVAIRACGGPAGSGSMISHRLVRAIK